jgi:hypothetical protein
MLPKQADEKVNLSRAVKRWHETAKNHLATNSAKWY